MSGRVAGKVALVTGGARGLGAADARRLAAEGATVVVTDVLDGGAVAHETGGLFLAHDVTDEARWIEVVAAVREQFGRLDVLVNNAGIIISGNPETTELADMRRVFAVAVEGTMLGVKHALPLLREGEGGSIVNLSSITAMRYFPDTLAYASAKGAIRSMTKSIAGYCRSQNYPVRCNSVHPSGIDTPMVRQRESESSVAKDAEAEAARIAMGLGHPRDVAELVLFLASDESRFINGAELVIDNGHLAI